MSLARQLAERITALHYDDLPPEAVYWSRVAVMDTVGVMLAGAIEAAPPRSRRKHISRSAFPTNRAA